MNNELKHTDNHSNEYYIELKKERQKELKELVRNNVFMEKLQALYIKHDYKPPYSAMKELIRELEIDFIDTNVNIKDHTTKALLAKNRDKVINLYKVSPNLEKLNENSIFRDGLHTIAGYSSSGKTSFTSQLALDILDNNDNTALVFYTLDDSVASIHKKLLKQYMYMKLKPENKDHDLYKYTIQSNDVFDLYEKNRDRFKENDLFDNDRIFIFENIDIITQTNINDIYKQLSDIKELCANSNYFNIKNKDDVKLIVIIDYLQILKHEHTNTREGLNIICNQIKNIQKRLNCMMLVLSQLSNDGNFRETSEIRNFSDIVLKIHSEKELLEKVYRKIDLESNNRHVIELFKNKDGEKGMYYLSKINNCYYFDDFIDYKLAKDNARSNNEIDISLHEYRASDYDSDRGKKKVTLNDLQTKEREIKEKKDPKRYFKNGNRRKSI